MSSGPDLFAATRPHDLPPYWDGMPVEWRGWSMGPTVLFLCPPTRERSCCPRCGSTAEQPMNRGTVYLPEGAARTIRRANLHRPVVATLHAFRCPDCRHDQVLDNLHDGRWWDLDPDDYLDEGSTP